MILDSMAYFFSGHPVYTGAIELMVDYFSLHFVQFNAIYNTNLLLT